VIASISAALRTNAWSATKFAHRDDQGILEQAALFEVIYQGGDQVVEQG
jgi:hypothetical protein